MSSGSPDSFRPSPPGARLVRSHFSLFGIPVRVASSFWIISLLSGIAWDNPRHAGPDLAGAVTWAAVVFVSILLHELGHALVARAFGAKPNITLYAMGGLTSYQGARMSRVQETVISAAGPGAGIALGGAVWLATQSLHLAGNPRLLVSQILWVNIGWSVINLLPVVPFDGGHILAAVLGPRRALTTAVISAVVGSAVAAAGVFYVGNLWLAFIFGGASMTAVGQVRYGWQAASDRRRGLEGELVRARSAMAAGEAEEVLRIGTDVVARARTSVVRNGGLLAIAWAEATRGKAILARQTLERLERGTPVDPYFLAAVEDALGSPVRARAILEAARQQGAKSADSTKLLIDLWARDGDMDRATQLATEDADMLGPIDARAVFSAALQSGAHHPAAELAARLYTLYGDPSDALDEARAFALAGDRSRAIDLLETLANGERVASTKSGRTLEPGGWVSDPAFATLRGDERFQRLVST